MITFRLCGSFFFFLRFVCRNWSFNSVWFGKKRPLNREYAGGCNCHQRNYTIDNEWKTISCTCWPDVIKAGKWLEKSNRQIIVMVSLSHSVPKSTQFMYESNYIGGQHMAKKEKSVWLPKTVWQSNCRPKISFHLIYINVLHAKYLLLESPGKFYRKMHWSLN